VLRRDLTSGCVDFNGNRWNYTRSLRLYGWLGVVSLEYRFVPLAPDVPVAGFYDAFVAWKNTDYLPYLRDESALNAHIVAHTQWEPSSQDNDLHRSVIRELRKRMQESHVLERRARRYVFHDCRPCFVVARARYTDQQVSSLLSLSDAQDGPADVPDVEHAGWQNVRVSSTGWSTVVVTEPGSEGSTGTVLDMLRLVHAQWFLCQIWISTYETDSGARSRRARERARERARTQLTLARDLVEIDDLDYMLKDPALLRVTRALGKAFGLLEHRQAAERRLKILENHAREMSEITQSEDAQRLQVLFSLSAIGTISGLIPALANTPSEPWRLVTAAAALLLAFSFTMSFCLLWRRRHRDAGVWRGR
jgi:hypothetical protein